MHWTKAAPAGDGHKLTEPRLNKSISSSETTIAELLHQAGYATAHYGKWHLSGGGPGQHGYGEHDGDTGNEHASQFKDPNPVDIFGMADRAAVFMEKSSKAKQPFFIQLSWHALHASGNANRATRAKYEQQMQGQNTKQINIAAITEDLDTGVGRVMAALERLGLAGCTYVIYMSDNGASGGRKVLNGSKGGLWEGGLRVPFIVCGPGVTANSWCHTRVVGYDLFPTFCQWAGISANTLPKGIEGGSIASLLANDGRGEVKRPREELVFHFPHYQGDTPHSAIFLGDLKLIHFYEDHRSLLFDLSKDIGERHDLAERMPAETKKLRERLENYLAAVDAQFPTDHSRTQTKGPGKEGSEEAEEVTYQRGARGSRASQSNGTRNACCDRSSLCSASQILSPHGSPCSWQVHGPWPIPATRPDSRQPRPPVLNKSDPIPRIRRRRYSSCRNCRGCWRSSIKRNRALWETRHPRWPRRSKRLSN